MSFAFVFPGQGSQAVGMLSDFADESVVRSTFDMASQVLGYDLWSLTQQGPQDELNNTVVTQPAMLTAGVACWRLWKAQGGADPALMAGHSLGEYTALVCAASLDFESALALVQERARLMQAAVPENNGAMAAVLGLDDDTVQAACLEAAEGEVVEAVNFNAPGQVVVAGVRSAVERAVNAAKQRGAKRALVLPVSVPSHCSLMESAAAKLAQHLAECPMAPPVIPVINNVDVKAESDPSAIRDALGRQLYKPVRWVEVIQSMASQGVGLVVEAGPGKVLMGLTKRIDKQIATQGIYDKSSLADAGAATQG
jgi:[acyl-carrier-protein] S-malonyltransferase